MRSSWKEERGKLRDALWKQWEQNVVLQMFVSAQETALLKLRAASYMGKKFSEYSMLKLFYKERWEFHFSEMRCLAHYKYTNIKVS